MFAVGGVTGYVAGTGGVIVDKKTQLLGGDRFSNTPITTHPTGTVGSVPASKGAGPETPVGGGDW